MSHTYQKAYLLSDGERKVLAILQKGPKSVSQLSLLLKLPRTTIYTPIKTLIERGLISSKKISKENVLQISGAMVCDKTRADVIEIIEGFDSIINLIVQLLTDSRYSKVKNIETTDGIRVLFHRKSLKEVMAINKLITSSGIVIEAVLEENYIDVYKKLAGKDKSSAVSKTLLGRPHNTSLIKKDFLQPHVQILVFKDVCLFVNWESLVAFKYYERSTVGFYDSYFDMLKSMAKKIDVNPLLR